MKIIFAIIVLAFDKSLNVCYYINSDSFIIKILNLFIFRINGISLTFRAKNIYDHIIFHLENISHILQI